MNQVEQDLNSRTLKKGLIDYWLIVDLPGCRSTQLETRDFRMTGVDTCKNESVLHIVN